MASTFSYNDGLRNGSRTPKLWVVHKGAIHTFAGTNIAGVVVVAGSRYQKNGKWSNTTYDLRLADGAIGCRLLAPLHGQVWPESDRQAAYQRFCREFKVADLPLEAFDAALLRDYPKSHARMVEGEAALASLDG